VIAAAEAASAGAQVEAVSAAASSAAAATSVLFYVDTLEHLRRGGRIGAAAALFGTALAVKPLLHVLDGRIAPLLRHFASERRATVIQLEAGASGRIFLRDGCLRMGRIGTAEPSSLAMFHKETGIGLDAQGYLALIDRTTGRPTGRVGEMFSWGAPNGAREEMPEVIALHVACGPGGVINVGNPESKFAFDRKYRHN